MNKKFTFKNGNSIPLIGFGTYLIKGDKLIFDVLDAALGAGYRLIDTATVYKNEHSIGKALKELLPKYNLKREDIFITSKLAPSDHGSKAYKSVEQSLKHLDCGYIDLYLIHWPGAAKIPVESPQNSTLRNESWVSLTKALHDNLIRNIGVSNYTVDHLKELLKNNHGVLPVLNQVEFHPKYNQTDLKKFCDQEQILLQAYSSLGGTEFKDDLLKDSTVIKIAEKLGKTPAQILLRWALQQNIGIIPKARSKERIQENINLDFEIPKEHFDILNNYGETVVKKYYWNPKTIQ